MLLVVSELLSAMVLARYSLLREIISGMGERPAVWRVLERREMGPACDNFRCRWSADELKACAKASLGAVRKRTRPYRILTPAPASDRGSSHLIGVFSPVSGSKTARMRIWHNYCSYWLQRALHGDWVKLGLRLRGFLGMGT
jgi:hypothetical protein